jgi:hypothetical protein
VSSFRKSLNALKGLDTFDITLLHHDTGEEFQDLDEWEKEEIITIKKNVMTGHSQRQVSKKMIIEAFLAGPVDIRGEERLVKPDQISSRTRRSCKVLEETGIRSEA